MGNLNTVYTSEKGRISRDSIIPHFAIPIHALADDAIDQFVLEHSSGKEMDNKTRELKDIDTLLSHPMYSFYIYYADNLPQDTLKLFEDQNYSVWKNGDVTAVFKRNGMSQRAELLMMDLFYQEMNDG